MVKTARFVLACLQARADSNKTRHLFSVRFDTSGLHKLAIGGVVDGIMRIDRCAMPSRKT